VKGNVEKGLVRQQAHPEHPVDGVGSAKRLEMPSQDVDGLAVHELVEGQPEHRVDRPTKPVWRVRADPGDDPIGRHGEQEAERLHRPEDVDGLAVAR
jgi:hypothetical protein